MAATLRAYGEATGAQRAVAVVEMGDTPALLEWTAAGVLVTIGDSARAVAGAGKPYELPELRAIPASALHVDFVEGAIHAPVGAVDHLAAGVRALAAAFGGLSVATADFATSDTEVTLTLAAREGEPVIAAVGEAQFLLE